MEERILELNINRFDKMIEKADSKANLILGFSGVLLTTVVLNNNSFFKLDSIYFKILHFLILVTLIIAIISSIIVVLPRGSRKHMDNCFYYESIKNMTLNEYKEKIIELGDSIKFRDELLVESRELALICEKKMGWNKRAILSLGIGLFLVAIVSLFTK